MTERAFPFTIDIDSRDGRRMRVTSLDVMRTLAGTRTVYTGVWDSRPVMAKVFTKFSKAKYHMKREWRGLQRLEQRGLSTPKPLFCGRCSSGWVVVTERIEGATSARELWDGAGTLEQRVSLLGRIAAQLARQHIKGVIQSDLHLGNFLVKGEEVIILDPATMRFGWRHVGRYRSVKQLALLTSILSERASAEMEVVFRQYAAARDWPVRPKDLERFRDAHRRHRRRAIERGLRKFLRSNRRHEVIGRESWVGVVERAFLAATDLDALTVGLDQAMKDGQVLKDGRTSLVSQTKLGNGDVVIKRYNHKSLLHSVRHTLKGSRARHCWLSANRLMLLGIPTARPLAYMERRRGLLIWESYFISGYVEGQRFHDFLQSDRSETERAEAMADVSRVLSDLAEHRITHGDMKRSNILISRDGPVLTDLDAMTVHSWRWTTEVSHRKDMARFEASCAAVMGRPP